MFDEGEHFKKSSFMFLVRYNNKTYRVDDIKWDGKPSDTFKLYDGSEITFAEYYQKVSSLLKFLDNFCRIFLYFIAFSYHFSNLNSSVLKYMSYQILQCTPKYLALF